MAPQTADPDNRQADQALDKELNSQQQSFATPPPGSQSSNESFLVSGSLSPGMAQGNQADSGPDMRFMGQGAERARRSGWRVWEPQCARIRRRRRARRRRVWGQRWGRRFRSRRLWRPAAGANCRGNIRQPQTPKSTDSRPSFVHSAKLRIKCQTFFDKRSRYSPGRIRAEPVQFYRRRSAGDSENCEGPEHAVLHHLFRHAREESRVVY